MPVYKGLAISGSIFIGKVKLFRQTQYPAFSTSIEPNSTEAELKRLNTAIKTLEKEISSDLNNPSLTKLDKEIITTHLMILTDIEIKQILESSIKTDLMSVPQAVLSSFDKIINNFEHMENSFYAQRAEDYKDVAQRLMSVLLDIRDKADLKYTLDDILFLPEITPSLVTRLAKVGLKAYCITSGSYTSHSSILSRGLGFTALLAQENILTDIKEGESAILNALNNEVVINPDQQQMSTLSQRMNGLKEKEAWLKQHLAEPAMTKNGNHVSVIANLEDPAEFSQVQDNHCAGIGLFRTEFIYLNRNSLPDEEEQTQVYTELLYHLKGLPVVFRTFDLGGDKLTYLQQYKREENPYLGCRGIRFSLQEMELFKTQIRAILRASVAGRVSIMFPMIIGVEDFLQAKGIVLACQNELKSEGKSFDAHIPLGAMIETPAAALCADQLAASCDFFSLGTNDLVQYTLAVDRNNAQVAPYYIQHHPAVLQLIKLTVRAAKQAGIPVSVCGEMASTPVYVPLLVGLGIEELSINPAQTAEVKAIIRNCDQALFDLVNNFDFNTDTHSIELFLNQTLKPYYTIQS
jgi:phosphoenolpyruvate-protein phosphotransferase (PTS system enzyme I)